MKQPALWSAHMGTQNSLPDASSTSVPALKQMLEAVVTLSWADIMQKTPDGQVDVEYRMAADGSVEFLRLWASTQHGVSDLICQYSMFWHWSSTQEVGFEAGYKSESLAGNLGYVLQHQASFQTPSAIASGWAQITQPTGQQTEAASRLVAANRPTKGA